jgi:hypothetical protein
MKALKLLIPIPLKLVQCQDPLMVMTASTFSFTLVTAVGLFHVHDQPMIGSADLDVARVEVMEER